MSNTAKKNAQLLGKSFGAAGGELKKSLLFHFAKKLGVDTCYRCGKPILTVAEFSIEHKRAWRSAKDPKATFYDLDNIAFSHLSCNASAGTRPMRKYTSEEERRIGKNEANNNWWYRHHEKNKIRHRQHAGQCRSSGGE